MYMYTYIYILCIIVYDAAQRAVLERRLHSGCSEGAPIADAVPTERLQCLPIVYRSAVHAIDCAEWEQRCRLCDIVPQPPMLARSAQL
jgi:hypothetical protein